MNVREVLQHGHDILLKSLEGISETDAVNIHVTDNWNVKDMVGHITVLDRVLSDLLKKQISDVATPYLSQYIDMGSDEFKNFNYGERKFINYKEVLAEFSSSHQHLMEMTFKVPDEMIKEKKTIPWYGPEYSIEDFIIYANYGHKCEHAGQINQFKHRLKDIKKFTNRKKTL
jgi:hypothetical protein